MRSCLWLAVNFAVLTACPTFAQDVTERSMRPGAAQILVDELTELRRELAALKQRKAVVPAEAASLDQRITELDLRLREVIAEGRSSDSLLEMNDRFTNQSLGLAATWVNLVAILFTVVVAAVGIGTFWESRHLRKEIDKDRGESRELFALLRREVESALTTLNARRDELSTDIAGFREEIREQNICSEQTRIFVQAVAEHFFSDTLLELLGALQKGGALTAEEDKALRDKTREIEARLYLLYPDSDRAEQAVRNLMALGGESALPDLSTFATASTTTPEQKALAHLAMIRISERRGASEPERFLKPRKEVSGDSATVSS